MQENRITSFNIFNDTKLVVLDIDGTLCNGDDVIEGAIRLVHYLQLNYRVIFFTNSSNDSSKYAFIRLLKLGFEVYEDSVYNVFDLIPGFLKQKNIDNVYVIGSNNLIHSLSNNININQNESANNVLVSLDKDFNYNKINIALSIILKGGKFIACNNDCNYPIENNKLLAGCGAMVGAISQATKTSPDYIIGKPHIYFLDYISEKYNVTNNEILIIGDRLESDIQMAINYKCRSILINKCNYKNSNTSLCFSNIKQILDYIKGVL